MTMQRVLLISYHFGGSGATGGFRWHGLTQELVRRGWEFDVITASASAEGMAGVAVHRVPDPGRAGGWIGLLDGLRSRGASAPPAATAAAAAPADAVPQSALRAAADALPIWKVGMRTPLRTALQRSWWAALDQSRARTWTRLAEAEGARLLAAHRYACIVVSSPPHVTQCAGRRLSQRSGIPFVADFRDPWVSGTPELRGYMSPYTALVGARQERAVHRASRLVVHNTPKALERALADARLPRVPRACVPNGYDAPPTAQRPDRDVFRVLFCGWLHPYMDVRVLFRAARRLADRHALPPETFRLEFMGAPSHIGPMPLGDVARAYGMGAHTDSHPRVSRDEALAVQTRAAVLVAFDCPHPLAVAMKFYDYMGMRGHLLMIAEPGSALDAAARQVGSRAVSPADEDGVLEVLDAGFARWQAGDFAEVNDPRGVFRRERRAAEMHDLLTAVAAGRDPRTA